MQPYPMSRSWPGHTPFTVAAVPTGRNAGVRKEPRSVAITPARARVPPSCTSTVNRTAILRPLCDQHGVAVTVEPVPFRHRRAVCRAHRLDPGESHHEGEKARTGEVEIRQKGIHRAEPVPGE